MDIIHQSMHISASWNLVKSRKIPLPWSNFIVLGVLLTMLQLIVSYAPVPVTLQDSNLSFYKSTKVTYQHGEVTKHVLFVVTISTTLKCKHLIHPGSSVTIGVTIHKETVYNLMYYTVYNATVASGMQQIKHRWRYDKFLSVNVPNITFHTRSSPGWSPMWHQKHVCCHCCLHGIRLDFWKTWVPTASLLGVVKFAHLQEKKGDKSMVLFQFDKNSNPYFAIFIISRVNLLRALGKPVNEAGHTEFSCG